VRLIEQLKAMGSDTQTSLDHLNAGGCCVYAAEVSSRLAELGVPVWGVVSSGWASESGLNINDIRLNQRPQNVREWNRAGIRFGHVLIQFVHGGEIWTHDSADTAPATTGKHACRTDLFGGYMTVPELKALAGTQEGWNSMFDREEGIPVIRQNVTDYLSAEALV
jgi:hypothetical protein